MLPRVDGCEYTCSPQVEAAMKCRPLGDQDTLHTAPGGGGGETGRTEGERGRKVGREQEDNYYCKAVCV